MEAGASGRCWQQTLSTAATCAGLLTQAALFMCSPVCHVQLIGPNRKSLNPESSMDSFKVQQPVSDQGAGSLFLVQESSP